MTDNSSSPTHYPPVSRPDEFARLSPRVQRAERHLQNSISQIRSPQSAAVISKMSEPLHETECNLLLPQNKTAQKKAPVLCRQLLTPLPYKAWWGAPAASEKSHHAYPGGWLLHTATNLYALEKLTRTACELRGQEVESDDLYAGMILHDILKPRLFLWKSSGEMDSNQGECGHHVAAIAEAYLQGASERVLISLAGVHSGWWHNRDAVAGFLQRAAELIGDSSLERIANSPSVRWELHFETEMMYQAERAWYTATRAALQQINQPLEALLKTLVPDEEYQAARWRVLLHCDEIELARQLGNGHEAFARTIKKVLSG